MKYFKLHYFVFLVFLVFIPLKNMADQVTVDSVVAVIGDEIILLSELQKQFNDEMRRNNLSLQSPRTQLLKLRTDVLQMMIDDRLLLEKARQDSVEIDIREVDAQVKRYMIELKKKAGSEEAYEKEIEEYGLTELELRTMTHNLIVKGYLKERMLLEMRRLISVTPQEVESWFTVNKDSLSEVPAKYKLRHILIYPVVAEEKKKVAKEKLEGILKRIRTGEDFAELAKLYSEDTGNSSNGGDLGAYFTRNEFDPDFTAAAFALEKGQISNIIETIHGFHIIKVEDIRGDRIRARHILILLVPDEADEKSIIEQLTTIRDDILSQKATFEEMVKKYSDDENTRDHGGEFDWFSADIDIPWIPVFLEQAKKLQPGDISETFKSMFGFHIVKMDDFKKAHTLNIKDDRSLIEDIIRQKKTITEFERIFQKLRKETYINIRL